MSNPLKGIGKVFKKVVKVVKKYALPIIAIGAVVLTGGAALGILPALGGAGGLLASIGISGPLAGILTSAANSAMFGAIGSALTGGSIIKGASMGFLTGGVLGGLGAAVGGPASGIKAAASGAATSGAASGTGAILNTTGAAGAGGAATGAISAPVSGAINGATTGLGAASSAAATASAPVIASAAAPASAGGFMGFLNQNPMLAGTMIQGLGGGLEAKAMAKENERTRQAIEANYADTSGLFRLGENSNSYLPDAGEYYTNAIHGGPVTYDRRRGRITANG